MPDGKKRYRNERLQIMLDEGELQAIENWRFRMRMPTRTAAVRELLRLGLQAAAQGEPSPTPDIRSKSTDYAVLEDDRSSTTSAGVPLRGPGKSG